MDDVDQTKGRGIGDGIDRKIALGHIDDGGVGGIADGKAKGKAIFFRLDFVALPFGRLKLAFGKDLSDVFFRSVGRDVEGRRRFAEKDITDGFADDISLESGVDERIENGFSRFRDGDFFDSVHCFFSSCKTRSDKEKSLAMLQPRVFPLLNLDIDFDKDFAKAEYPFPHRTSLGFLEFGMF